MYKLNTLLKKCKEKYKTVFEACGEESNRDTFKSELNYEAGKLFFTMLIAGVAWLPYIPNDSILHQYPTLAVSIRIGLTVLSASLIALKFTKRFRNRPDIMMMIMIGYLNFGTALITGTSGENSPAYIGGFCFILMISTFAPYSLKYKYIYSVSSLALFFATGIITGLDFQSLSVRYSINDLVSAFALSMMLFYILNSIKYVSWKRRRKSMEFAEETIRLAEKVEAASKAKSDFLAKMSHEIRTPMNAITGMAELALRENIPPTAKEQIITIKQAGANLLSIINDILDFSKIESGKLEIVPGDYLFSSLVNDVVNIIRMRVVDSRLSFVVNVDGNIPNALFGDETRIRQVMLNILSNAVKYTKKGFISFSISGEITGDIVLLTIDVTDSGKGIKPEDIKKLFGDFVQVDLVSNKGVEGTGLGLAITRNLVRAMKGDVSIQSEYKKGSTFTITLPQKIRSMEPLAAVENPEEKSVLVYEQSEIYADSIVCTIDNLGVNCERAKDDDELREKLKAREYSFVFASYFLLGNVKRALDEFKASTQIVLLTEFGNVTSDKSLSVLAMPVHSISVANMLNGVSDHFSYSASEDSAVRFKAPSARVLVVDDISTNLKVAEGLMLPYEMQIDLCLSGAEAINAAMENSYDIIFMDHMMPEMDGVEATKHIRELGKDDKSFLSLPIVALTANAVSGTKEMFLENGFDDFISKPIDTVKLNSILEKLIPKEKKEKLKESDKVSAFNDSSSSIGIEIKGIDTKKGISMMGGNPKLYLQTLAVFYKDGHAKIEEIKKSLETDNYPLYTTYVHALKSASASIGAIELSEAARKLEIAGKQEDLVFIKQSNAQFLIDLNDILSGIETVLNAKRKDDKAHENINALNELLEKLKEALGTLDSSAIDEAASGLQEFTQANKVGAAVENILQNTLIGEYDEAVLMINALLKETK